MVNSGSSALMIAMRLANLPLGSEVVTPALTFSSDVAAIYHVGCTPVFIDSGLSDYQLVVDRIEGALSDQTRAILIPDLVGGMCDWDAVREVDFTKLVEACLLNRIHDGESHLLNLIGHQALAVLQRDQRPVHTKHGRQSRLHVDI